MRINIEFNSIAKWALFQNNNEKNYDTKNPQNIELD